MMTSPEIRSLIAQRLTRGEDMAMHPESLAHHEGIFRGLIWALTGEDPGRDLLRDTCDLLEKAGIAYLRKSKQAIFALHNGELLDR